MEYKEIEKESFDGKKVKILGETYEPGEPNDIALGKWRGHLTDRAQKLAYIKSCERYLYGNDGFGSEKRKNPA